MISPKRLASSIRHALRGLWDVLVSEHSFRVQVFGAILVIIAMVVVHLATWERILLILLIASVLVLEVINSIFERFGDALKPRMSPVIREVKDMMAGAVFLTSLTAVLVGVLIFWPHRVAIFNLVSNIGVWYNGLSL